MGAFKNVKILQLMGLAAHLVTTYVAIKIYKNAFKDHPEKRHIIFLLTLGTATVVASVESVFNDIFNVMVSFIAIYCFQNGKNFLGVIAYSVALSIKMNVLLYLPAVYFILSLSQGIFIGTFYMVLIAVLQGVYAYPFLSTYPASYIAVAYNFGRQFNVIGSMTFFFVPKIIFNSGIFSKTLLALHVVLLVYFLMTKWSSIKNIWKDIHLSPIRICPEFRQLDPYFVTQVFFLCNFIGIVCARSLHIQFIVWYWFSVPFLLYNGNIITSFELSFKEVSMMLFLNAIWSIDANPGIAPFILAYHVWVMYHNINSKKVDEVFFPIKSN